MLDYLNDALTRCEQLLEQPDLNEWLSACFTVGNILSGMGFMEEAYHWREMALEPEPDVARFYAEIEFIYRQCAAWSKAVEACQRLLKYEPRNSEVHYRLALAYGQLGDRSGEADALYQLFNLKPRQAAATEHYRLGRALQRQGRYSEAQVSYQRALAQAAATAQPTLEMYDGLSQSLIKQGRWDEVITVLQQRLALDPNSAKAHHQLGRAYRQQQQLELAIVHFREAITLDPDLHWAYMGLLNTLMKLQQWDEVVATCQAIIHFIKAHPWAYCFMGNALAHKGETLQAAACHQKAFALQGWQGCIDHNYQFGLNWFSQSLTDWQAALATLPSTAPLQVLELGSGDASTTCWLVDQILVHPASRLTHIAPTLSDLFQQNLMKLPERQKVTVKTGELLSALLAIGSPGFDCLAGGFDLIHVQCKQGGGPEYKDQPGRYIEAIATLAWERLKPTGVMIFKDYQQPHPSNPQGSLKAGIDGWVKSLGDQVEILHQAHQILLRKRQIA